MQNTSQQEKSSVSRPQANVDNIGRLLLQLGKIRPEDTETILRVQHDQHLRFGDAALKLGLITEADISQALALQFNYPYLQPGQGSYSNELVAAYQPFSKQVEALRALRSQLMVLWFNQRNKSLAMVSSNAGEGVSYLSANLAIMFSQLGERTLLIDANMRNPRQQAMFNLRGNLGLSDIIAGRAGLEAIKKIEFFEDLSVLSAGTIPPNPQELLNRLRFAHFMNYARSKYDIVLVDAAPAKLSADAQVTAANCGGALLISRLNHTCLSDITEVRNQIAVTGAQVVGAVINEF